MNLFEIFWEAIPDGPPHLHLTTSKVMVIVWRLRGNISRTVLYIANVLPLQWAQLTKTVHTARLHVSISYIARSQSINQSSLLVPAQLK